MTWILVWYVIAGAILGYHCDAQGSLRGLPYMTPTQATFFVLTWPYWLCVATVFKLARWLG